MHEIYGEIYDNVHNINIEMRFNIFERKSDFVMGVSLGFLRDLAFFAHFSFQLMVSSYSSDFDLFPRVTYTRVPENGYCFTEL